MKLHTVVAPYYLPDPNQDTVMRLGLQPLQPTQWMHVDADFEQFHSHKQRLVSKHPGRVFAELEESIPPQREFSSLLREHLLQDHAGDYELRGDALVHIPGNLSWEAGNLGLHNSQYWVQEDLCILQPTGDRYRLTAASVCSPSNWALEKKIGRTVDRIHTPVPRYQDLLARRVNKLLHGLKPAKPMLRCNWSLQPGNELFWRNDLEPAGDDEETYWRVERQTLVKLPQTNAVVFGIRIFLHPLASLGEGREHIEAVVARLPEAERIYKNLK